MRQHSSIRVSRLSPVHTRRCAAMSLVAEEGVGEREPSLIPHRAICIINEHFCSLPPSPPHHPFPTTHFLLFHFLLPLFLPPDLFPTAPSLTGISSYLLPPPLSLSLTRISSQPPPLLHGCVYRSPSRVSTLPPGCGRWTLVPIAASSQSTPVWCVVRGVVCGMRDVWCVCGACEHVLTSIHSLSPPLTSSTLLRSSSNGAISPSTCSSLAGSPRATTSIFS